MALDNNFSEHCDLVEFLINLTEVINLHIDEGVTRVSNTLQQYLQDLKDYDQTLIEKGLGTKCFVGRDRELGHVVQTLMGDGKGTVSHVYIDEKRSVIFNIRRADEMLSIITCNQHLSCGIPVSKLLIICFVGMLEYYSFQTKYC